MESQEDHSNDHVPEEVLSHIDHLDNFPRLPQFLVLGCDATSEVLSGVNVVQSAPSVDRDNANVCRKVEDVSRYTHYRLPEHSELTEGKGVEEGRQESHSQRQKQHHPKQARHQFSEVRVEEGRQLLHVLQLQIYVKGYLQL